MATQSSVSITGVTADQVGLVWPVVRSLIVEATERSGGRHNEATILDGIMARKLQLWLAVDGKTVLGLAVTEIVTQPTGIDTCRVLIVTGQDAAAWFRQGMDTICAWAQEKGCRQVETLARKGWARRLADFKLTHVLLEKELD